MKRRLKVSIRSESAPWESSVRDSNGEILAANKTREITVWEVENLRIHASLKKKPDGNDVTGTVTIYNAAPDSVETIRAAKNSFIQIYAGHEGGEYGLVFAGEIKRIDEEVTSTAQLGKIKAEVQDIPEGSNRKLELMVGGSGRYLLKNWAQVSLPGVSTIQKAITALLKDVPLPTLGITELGEKSIEDWSFAGRVEDGLNELFSGEDYYYTWWVEDRMIVFTLGGKPLVKSYFDLDGDFGMIGFPCVTSSGIAVKVILNPSFQVGDTINLKSLSRPTLNGEYSIKRIDYELDNMGDDFFCELTLGDKA